MVKWLSTLNHHLVFFKPHSKSLLTPDFKTPRVADFEVVKARSCKFLYEMRQLEGFEQQKRHLSIAAQDFPPIFSSSRSLVSATPAA